MRAGLVAAVLLSAARAIPAADTDEVRRLLTLLAAAATEYGEAFDPGGRLSRPIEREEARLLVAEARDRVARLGAELAPEAERRLATIAARVDAAAAAPEITTALAVLIGWLSGATGVPATAAPPTPPSPRRGEPLYRTHCAGCHGATGAGDGPDAAALERRPADFTAVDFMRGETPADFFHVVSVGRRGGGMPAWEDVLSVQERWDVVSFVWSLVPTRAAAAGRVLEARRLVAATVDAHRAGEARAADLAAAAYAAFEPLEQVLGAVDPGLVSRAEEAFLSLRLAVRERERPDEVARRAALIGGELEQVQARLESRTDAYARFAQAVTIILREGFEVVLVIGALLAYASRAGAASMRRPIHVGTLLGIAASVVTAALLVTLLRLTAGAADLLEGVAMLAAAAVLFWVSYWLVSKAEAARWQRYIQGKVQHALATGSGIGLAFAAFLAVYREGFETVLFYRALFGAAPAGDVMVPAGFLVGSALLGVVYALFRRIGRRLPMRAFFLSTGALLYLMAAIFAGQGVRELQEVNVIRVTPIRLVPEFRALGIFPTLETLVVQAVFVLLLGYALIATARRAAVAGGATGPAARGAKPA
jgi:high-affinity iron transporter